MPELPEVETVRRGLEPAMEGETIDKVELSRGDLRRPFPAGFARRIAGRKVERLERRAKYLVARLEGGLCLVMHLGMSGSFRIEGETTKTDDRPHDHVRFLLGSGSRVIYNDPRRFGSMDLIDCDRLEETEPFKSLGIEPLAEDLDAAWLAKRLAGKATSIKAALLDQRIVAGLGNIYVCEALWEAGISPLRDAGSLVDARGRPTAACRKLPGAIRKVLNAAIASGGSSLRNHFRADGTLGDFQHQFRVYGREGEACLRDSCRGTVKRIVQGGRSTFYCPKCQR